MSTRSMAVMIVVGACVLGLSPMASAQNAVGGPKKPVTVGGAAKQNSPVMPANKGGAAPISSPAKCPAGHCGPK
jgi:hypothetical protein